MTIEQWREQATHALNLGAKSEEGQQIAAHLIREFNFDMAYGGPLARLDDDGYPLEDDEVNELCRTFGYAEIAGD
jgi:hypothetical protein